MVIGVAKKILAVPAVFDLYQHIVGAHKCHVRFVRDWLKPREGDRLLDVGCGTGALMPYLPAKIDLLGVDISEPYIRAANARFGDRAEFRVADASDQSLDLGAAFDLAFASGVLHHIPDELARRAVAGAVARLKPGGRFVSIDPTLIAGQGWFSRTMVMGDRGEFVRSPAQLAALMAEFSPRFETATDTMHIPYAHVIMTIEKS